MASYYSSSPRSRGSFGGGRSNGRNNGKRSGGPKGKYINPSKFVRKATISEQEVFVPKNSFADFEIHDILKANIVKKNFVNPSPIQDQTIPLALQGNDVIGIANTGTGKTAAFGIPMLHKLMTKSANRALVLAPTRELAQQIEDELRELGKGTKLYGALLIGGVNIMPQLRDLRANPQVVIGTPGRVKDHMERGSLNLADFNLVVLDEVDRMLDMGFVYDIREILSELHEDRQSLFFSATFDQTVRQLISQFSADPVSVTVKTSDSSESVHQDVVNYRGTADKMDKLHDLLNDEAVQKVIVFDETQRSVERLANELSARGFASDAIHGGKSQGQRQRALEKFKKNNINILVATDVAARGIDVSDVTHVVNYSVPQSYEDYVHRIGRAGRAGRIGYAYTFVG
jgi:ATP-dependent RNA helicase RhlE